MTLILFVATVVISSFLFIGAQEANDCTDPRGRLAWKALQSADEGHMLYTSFDASVIVCTYVTQNSEDSSTMSVRGNFIYQINDLPLVYNDPITTKVENCEGLVAVYNETSGEKVSQSVILYSDFGTCTIFFNIEQQECQLWAYRNASNDVVQGCLGIYKTICEGEIYEVYNSTCLT
ncbi:uncharacterized protein LOC115313422 [Ixodes scapularis]|uniref:uncharacterized protein LOC115313422 n=1 Tax=Ixodes scapularis TaxID=6945 RepID=UPI001A9E6064|nr:uncharacterized protein LOC115313422 [Ixodes scapularis]